MAEVPGTSSETITETVQTNTPPPPQQVTMDTTDDGFLTGGSSFSTDALVSSTS